MKAGEPAEPSRRSLLDWPQAAGVAEDVQRELARRRQRRRRRLLAEAAVALTLAIGVAWWRMPAAASPVAGQPAPSAVAAASAAEPPRQMMLSDGSLVELKGDAEIAVEFTPAVRRIVLQHGTAHFQVAKNAARPFVVDAGGIQVCAVGTAFSVQRASRAIEVLVTEGRVRVDETREEMAASPTAVAVPLAVVDAGDAVLLPLTADSPTAPAIHPVTPAELDQRLAWRAPKLEFSATPLREALVMVNRHTRRQLVLADPALGELRLSGILRADNTTALLRLLENEFGIVADERGDAQIILQRNR